MPLRTIGWHVAIADLDHGRNMLDLRMFCWNSRRGISVCSFWLQLYMFAIIHKGQDNQCLVANERLQTNLDKLALQIKPCKYKAACRVQLQTSMQ